MEDRVRDLELSVAVIKSEMSALKDAVEKNTEAQQQVALALAGFKGGKAVLLSVGIAVFSVIGLLVSWLKGS